MTHEQTDPPQGDQPEERALTSAQPAAAAVALQQFSPAQVELIKRTICVGATDDELQFFLALAQRTGLNPFTRQIWAWKQRDERGGGDKLIIQTSIDGFLALAQDTGLYEGFVDTLYCGPDGKWVDFWPDEAGPPTAAKIGILKKGLRLPFPQVAYYKESVRRRSDGNPNAFWRDMPRLMLEKVARSRGLRAAFPQELGGLYTDDELPQESQEREVDVKSRRTSGGGDADHARAQPQPPRPRPQPDQAVTLGNVTDVLTLFRYAMQEHEWQPADVCRLFGAEAQGRVAAKIQERFDGDYQAAAQEIDRYVTRMEQVADGGEAGQGDQGDQGDQAPPSSEERAAQGQLEV